MKKKLLSLVAAALLLTGASQAQTRQCATTENLEARLKSDPKLAGRMAAIEQQKRRKTPVATLLLASPGFPPPALPLVPTTK